MCVVENQLFLFIIVSVYSMDDKRRSSIKRKSPDVTQNSESTSSASKENEPQTCIPPKILREIVTTLGYDANSGQSGPDGKSDHTLLTGLERTIVMKLGNDPLLWSDSIQRRPYSNVPLGEAVYLCFRPVLPKNMVWLDSNAIYDAIRVYENHEGFDFSFYGPLASGQIFQPKTPIRKTKKYAFAINTGKMDMGSHWVVVFADMTKGIADYFDSFGGPPTNKGVQITIKSIMNYLIKMFPENKLSRQILFSSRKLQYGTTECGVYIVHFIIERLLGSTFIDFVKEGVSDSECRKLRNVYWNQIDIDTSQFKYT